MVNPYDQWQEANEKIDEVRREMRLLPQTAPLAEEYLTTAQSKLGPAIVAFSHKETKTKTNIQDLDHLGAEECRIVLSRHRLDDAFGIGNGNPFAVRPFGY